MRPRLTQRPNPVPFSPLVVKKGAKRFLRTPGRDAGASIEDGYSHSPAGGVRREAGFAHVQNQPASIRHHVESIAHQVGEHLPQFAGKSSHRRHRFKTLIHINVGLPDLRRKQNQHALQRLRKIYLNRHLRFAMEGQELSRDLGNAGQLIGSEIKVLIGSLLGVSSWRKR